MWYEILPVMGLMTGLMAAPPVIVYFYQSLLQNGNPCKRSIADPLNRRQFLRDERLTGNTYVIYGLEKIPDP